MAKNKEIKSEQFWWLKTPAYLSYVIRECSGLLIVLYFIFQAVYLIIASISDMPQAINALALPMQILGLCGALIHTFTWLPVIPKILPFELEKKNEVLITLILILSWIGISGFVYLIFIA